MHHFLAIDQGTSGTKAIVVDESGQVVSVAEVAVRPEYMAGGGVEQDPDRRITVVLAEFVPRRPWEYLLHNQTALRLKLRLFFKPNVIVVDVPYHVARAA
jgi:hypothetical protein